MKKQWIAILIAALFLAACTPKKEKAGQLSQLTFVEVMTNPTRTATIQGIISDFQKTNPSFSIELISPPYEQADNKLTLMLNSKQDVDIAEIRDMTTKQFVNNENLTDLSPYLASWDGADDLLPLANAAARIVDNTPYVIPQFFYIKALFVRTDILKKYGYDTLPQTVEELYQMSVAITNKADDQFGFGFRGKHGGFKNSDILIFSDVNNIDPDNIYRTVDGGFAYDNPEARQALKDYVDLYKNAVPADGINWGFNEQVNGFISGITPFLVQDPDTVSLVDKQLDKENYTVIPMPVGKSGKVYLDYGFAGLGIPSYSKKKDAAWEFISYIVSPQENAAFCKEYGALPVHRSTYQQDPYFSSGVYKAWETTMTDTQKYVFVKYPLESSKFPGWSQFQEQTMQSLLLGETTADEAIQKWAEYWGY